MYLIGLIKYIYGEILVYSRSLVWLVACRPRRVACRTHPKPLLERELRCLLTDSGLTVYIARSSPASAACLASEEQQIDY